ncbi:peptidase [Geothrix limicola]|uniref:Aminopeptidase N n=1 Tax=Geothrix limicola TaxID=2927978 RepID=A0ABQ5QB88_9BACT|nr:M1 family metallopeptidase [Geothrix limicola]GLH71621.1 peptidase [Geothrix limicola]
MRLSPLILAGLIGTPLMADTYPRQPGVEVQHYVFRLEVTDQSDGLLGEATVTLRLREDGVKAVILDLASVKAGRGMAVRSVSLAGRPVPYTHEDGRLKLALGAARRAGDVLVFEIRYGGVPAAGLKFLVNKHGERGIFSESWPDRAHQWLPVMDHPSAKATAEMVITAPAHDQVISNGRLIETTDLPGQRRRTHWKQDQPLPVWLYTVGIGHFAVHRTTADALPLESWVFPQERESGWRALEDTARQVLGFYSARIGPFPYDKLANVEAAGITGGMESATAISYGEAAFDGRPMTSLVAHEIAHQWFGDAVTEADWDDVWLSEGFATYLTDCFLEHAQGREAFVASLRKERAQVISEEAARPDTPVVHRNLSDTGKVLNAFVYEKAAWVLHMLRNQVGDAAFWRGLQAYFQGHRHGLATTADVRHAMEAASGQNLEPFFHQWLDRPGIPKLQGTWRYEAEARQLVVDLRQTQAGEAFQMPLSLSLGLGGRVETVLLSQKQQCFTFPMSEAPAFVEVDPNTVALIDGPGRLDPPSR